MFVDVGIPVCFGLFFLVAGVAGIWLLRSLATIKARAVKLEREGEIVKAWVVFANENLYQRNRSSTSWKALFVCTFEDLPDLEDRLEEWAEGIRKFEVEDESIHEEDAIAAVLRTQIGYPHPIRVPDRITNGHEAYFISFSVLCRWLPKGKLTKPYVYCKFYKGEDRDDGDARMVPYSEADEDWD